MQILTGLQKARIFVQLRMVVSLLQLQFRVGAADGGAVAAALNYFLGRQST